MTGALWLLIGFGGGGLVGMVICYRLTTPVWEAHLRKGMHALYELGVVHGREIEAAAQATDRYARVMGGIHHPLGSPLRYSDLADLMPRVVEES